MSSRRSESANHRMADGGEGPGSEKAIPDRSRRQREVIDLESRHTRTRTTVQLSKLGAELMSRSEAHRVALAEAAGVAATTPTGTTELRAMYGGLQAGIGVLALLATFRRDLIRTALIALGFLAGGLFTARVCGALLDGGLSWYTAGALVLEITLAVVSTGLLRTHPRAP